MTFVFFSLASLLAIIFFYPGSRILRILILVLPPIAMYFDGGSMRIILLIAAISIVAYSLVILTVKIFAEVQDFISHAEREFEREVLRFGEIKSQKENLDIVEKDLRARLDAIGQIFRISARIAESLDAKSQEIFDAFKPLFEGEYFRYSVLFRRTREGEVEENARGEAVASDFDSWRQEFMGGRVETTVPGGKKYRVYEIRLPIIEDVGGYVICLERGQENPLEKLLANLMGYAVQRNFMVRSVQEKTKTDGLTGLFNRRELMKALRVEIDRIKRHPAPLSVIFLDIDHFKSINDKFGHPTGDTVLVRLAAIIARTAKLHNGRAARFGGEEFVILFPERQEKGAGEIMEKLRHEVEGTDFDLPKQTTVCVSAGVFESGDAALGPQEILDAADKALYASKTAGRNRVTLYSTIRPGSKN